MLIVGRLIATHWPTEKTPYLFKSTSLHGDISLNNFQLSIFNSTVGAAIATRPAGVVITMASQL